MVTRTGIHFSLYSPCVMQHESSLAAEGQVASSFHDTSHDCLYDRQFWSLRHVRPNKRVSSCPRVPLWIWQYRAVLFQLKPFAIGKNGVMTPKGIHDPSERQISVTGVASIVKTLNTATLMIRRPWDHYSCAVGILPLSNFAAVELPLWLSC